MSTRRPHIASKNNAYLPTRKIIDHFGVVSSLPYDYSVGMLEDNLCFWYKILAFARDFACVAVENVSLNLTWCDIEINGSLFLTVIYLCDKFHPYRAVGGLDFFNGLIN